MKNHEVVSVILSKKEYIALQILKQILKSDEYSIAYIKTNTQLAFDYADKFLDIVYIENEGEN